MPIKTPLICLLIFLSTLLVQAEPDPDPLSTTAERTGFRQTGRYEEMTRLCRRFEERWPDAVRVYDFGLSPEGRPMKAMVVSLSGILEPATAGDNPKDNETES